MEQQTGKRYAASQERNWEQIRSIGHTAATAAGLKGDYGEDCAMDFVVYMTDSSPDPKASQEDLAGKAERFARRVAYRLQHQRRRVKSLEEVTAEGKALPLADPVSREPGPEEIMLRAEFLRRLLAPLPEFLPAQQVVFVGRILRNKRFVDLEQETGRSANALAKSLANIIRRLQGMYAEQGIDAAEILEELNRLDRENTR